MQNGKEDSQHLMDSVLPLAEKLLIEHGDFFPYGGAMTPNGEIVSVAAYDGDEHPPSSELINLLNQAFRQAAANKQYKATALVYDVRIKLPNGEPSDAIAVNLDHETGYTVVVFLPYVLINGNLEFGQIFAQEGKASVFK